MPLFDYHCNDCGSVTEVSLHASPVAFLAASCGRCASVDTVRLVSRFSSRPRTMAKYGEDFRERTLPYLKSRPGVREILAEGGQSEEATTYELTERIGARVDSALEGMSG